MSETVAKAAVRVGVSANAVSFMGLACGLGAAAAYFRQPHPAFATAGFLLMIAWHVFDGADGRVARATGTSSPFGRLIDGVCDHVVFIAVYVALVLSMTLAGASPMIWLILVAAGASHAAQAAAYEERRQQFERRSGGVDRPMMKSAATHAEGAGLVYAYDRLQQIFSGGDSGLDKALADLRKQGAPADAIQALVNETAPIVRFWGLLNANNRTLAIAIAVLAGRPLWFFIYEAVFLNIVFFGLIVIQRRAELRIARAAPGFA
jgi:phosphatidylglycerophosphate synthase